MSNLTSTIGGCYTLHTFETLRDLWQQMAQTIGSPACCVTNADLPDSYAVRSDRSSLESNELPDVTVDLLENLPQFLLLCSERFQALLIGTTVCVSEREQIEIEITFLATAIEQFLKPLIPNLTTTLPLIADLNFVNDRYLENHFAQMSASILAIADSQKSTRISLTPDLHVVTSLATDLQASASMAFDRREMELQQQVAQADLLNQIITQIHQTFDLSATLQSTVEQVQTFLHADRLIIYQFEFEKKANNKDFDAARGEGKVAYESIGTANLQSVLNVAERENCFDDRQLWERYRDGMTKAIDNVDREYADNRCMLDLMARSQIKSKLVVPIVVNSQLWGLLIAHQCHSARHWQVRETQFLQKVAEHLALAIDRAELHAASLWHTQNLERRVNERTRELRDAVLVAQTANQSKTDFLALLSHELRTPLTSILGLSATLLRLPLLNLNERQQNYLNIIHNSGEHLSELIDDILDFYKLEVGKTFLKSGDFFVSKQIEQVVELVKPKADYAKIDIQVEIIDNNHSPQLNGRDLRFRGDAKRVRQILLNILTNAIKFTPDNGTIAIRSWLENGFIVFEIEDSGIGIEAEQIPRLFKKFHQLDRNFDRDYGGMGLGLAITQQLVELHGGSIEVESVLGSGSTFTVRLAAQPLPIPERNDWREMDRQLVFQDPELNPIPNRIVLIEHDEDLATFMCDILTAARYQVTWLLSAESSFRQISMFEPSLIIIDLALNANVVDRLLDNIRRSSKIGYTKILAIATKDDIVSPISKQYIDDYLWKQVNPEHLLRKITKLLSGVESRMREEI